MWVHFGGVNNACYVWLNGKLLGYSQDSCCPAEFEVTTALRPGENVLAVQVQSAGYLSDMSLHGKRRMSGYDASCMHCKLNCLASSHVMPMEGAWPAATFSSVKQSHNSMSAGDALQRWQLPGGSGPLVAVRHPQV